MTQEEFISSVRGDETRWWLCEGRGDGAHTTLVLGWVAMVRRLAMECIDHDLPPDATQTAELWLVDSDDGWEFGQNDTARWRWVHEDGEWLATLVTDASAVIAP